MLSPTRARLVTASSIALVALGMLAAWLASDMQARADRAFADALTRALTRAHEIDLMTRVSVGTRPDAKGGVTAELLAELTAAMDRAESDAERAALAAVRACVAPAGTGQSRCAGDIESAVLAVKNVYAAPLRVAHQDRDSRASLARWVLIGGGLAVLAGLLLAFLTSRRAPAVPVSEEPPSLAFEATLRNRLEQLYQSRKRVRDNERFAAFGEIAAGLSHGLKTPLAAMRAAAQVAQARIGYDHPAADNLADIIDEIDGLVDQIVRFLATMGSGAPAMVQVPPQVILDALDEHYRHAPGAPGVAWECVAPGGQPDTDDIMVEPELLQMALRNLIDNAFSAAPEGTTVRLSAGMSAPPARAGLDEKAPAGALREVRWIEFAVSDRGPGIPGDIAEREVQRSSRPGGSGLGLAIARRIAARHGGRLELATGADTGTRARILLPPARGDNVPDGMADGAASEEERP